MKTNVSKFLLHDLKLFSGGGSDLLLACVEIMDTGVDQSGSNKLPINCKKNVFIAAGFILYFPIEKGY